jgi:hypothetical protein
MKKRKEKKTQRPETWRVEVGKSNQGKEQPTEERRETETGKEVRLYENELWFHKRKNTHVGVGGGDIAFVYFYSVPAYVPAYVMYVGVVRIRTGFVHAEVREGAGRSVGRRHADAGQRPCPWPWHVVPSRGSGSVSKVLGRGAAGSTSPRIDTPQQPTGTTYINTLVYGSIRESVRVCGCVGGLAGN